MKTVDCRNMECPAPVITVKQALETERELRVILDDGAPRENVTRFAKNKGFWVSEKQDGRSWVLNISANTQRSDITEEKLLTGQLVLVTSNSFGNGPEELGRLLMKNFIHTLLETSELPTRMIFMNNGAMLTTEGSVILEALEKLAGMGVEILTCGLCLDFLDLKSKLKVGATTNMLFIAESLLTASRVIRL